MTGPGELRTRLALVLPDGTPVGMTPVFAADNPWWRDASATVRAAREAFGIDVVVLRLASLRADDAPPSAVYTAEISAVPRLRLDPIDPALLADDPLRMPWARPGGPDVYLDWARDVLGARLTGEPVQMRTWNLSMLWALPTESGTAWLKAVPPFFAHEGAVLERLRDFPVPRLIARRDDAVIMAGIPGEDRYEPTDEIALGMVDILVDMQTRVDPATLPAMPLWTPASLAPLAERTLRLASEVSSEDRQVVSAIIERLPALQAELDECGLPATLVHGDFHPGNVRGDDDHLVLLDWGDSGIAHPLLDVAAFTERMPAPSAARITAHWLEAWRRAVPGSDPARALTLLAPYAALHQATVYRGFLDRIEPSERVYHAHDPADWLRRAAALAR